MVLDPIRRFVNRHLIGHPSGEPEPGRGQGPPPVALAACALLLELAHADGEFTAAERSHIQSAVVRHFGLDTAQADELLALAEAERQESIDHFQFTRLIAEHYDLGQKMVLAEVMWGVILADGTIAEHEARLVRKLASLLELEPAYLSEARKQASARAP